MEFFKSVFSDDPDQKNRNDTSSDQPQSQTNSIPNTSPSYPGADVWSFGSLLKTLSTRSETVLETYRRDLKEFGSGLKQETEAIREAAGRAVKDLPASMEVAQGSLETVFKSTAEIVSHGKDAILTSVVESSDSSKQPQQQQRRRRNNNNDNSYSGGNETSISKQPSGFSARVRAVQVDSRTYCEEPEDLEDYGKWKSGFVLGERGEEIQKLIEDNGAIESVYRRVVPNEVEHQMFWSRYFYKIHRLKQAEETRANLVKRAISIEDEEGLSWDDEEEVVETNVSSGSRPLTDSENVVDPESKKNVGDKVGSLESEASMQAEEEEGDSVVNRKSKNQESQSLRAVGLLAEEPNSESADVEAHKQEDGAKESSVAGTVAQPMSYTVSEEENCSGGTARMKNVESVLVSNSNEKMGLKGSADMGESSKDINVSVVSKQQSLPVEEDLGWDEVEDLANNDEKKKTPRGSPNKTDVWRRLSVAKGEEDLSWDIEDDGDASKA